MRALLLDSVTLRSLIELPVSEYDATDEANGYGDMTLTVAGVDSPEILSLTYPWRTSVALLDDSRNVLWLGPIIKREGQPGAGTLSLTARQWEGYLDRVFLSDEYDDDGSADAATVIASRLTALKALIATHPLAMKPPLPTVPAAMSGVTVEYSWRSSVGVGRFSGEPPSVLDDIGTVTSQGARFAFVPSLTSTGAALTLAVDGYALTPAAIFQVGYDIADLALATDGTAQATQWWLVGEDASLTSVATAETPGEPLLMATRSYTAVASQAALDGLAGALLSTSYLPVPVARELVIAGTHRVRAGDVVQIDVPAGVSPQLWPTGRSWIMRASTVSWKSSDGGATTTLTLSQPLDEGVAVWAMPPTDITSFLNELSRQVRRNSTRR